jgi:hypothetical protein
MCDPMSMIAAVGSIASSVISYSGQMSAMNAQKNANAQWIEWQRNKSSQEWQRQEQMRARAEAQRKAGEEKLRPEDQKQAQGEEQQRLVNEITPKDMVDENPQLIGDKLLSGMHKTAAPVMEGIANKLTQASRDARSRIAALATLQSYGPSQFGMQNRVNNIFRESGQEIAHQGNLRGGSLGAYNVEKGVQPVTITSTPSPWGGIAGALAGIAGKGAGNMF